MEKITSFTVDHLHLQPGIYESRIDWIKEIPIKTYDLRVTTPNYEPVLNTAEIHTIEHLAATYMRNHPQYKDDVIVTENPQIVWGLERALAVYS